MPAGVESWDNGTRWGKQVGGLSDPLGMGSERNGRPWQVFCYRAGDDWELDLKE